MPRVSAIQPTDEELLARVAEGDRDAFGDLYQRYARAVLGLALRRLGDRGRAEDARPGGVRVDLACGRGATSPTAARSRRGSTPSRGTRSPTAGARATEHAGRAARHAVRRARPGRAGRAVLGRLARAPSDGGPARRRERDRARARVLERAVAERDRRLPRHPARYREDAHAQRPARGSRRRSEEELVSPEHRISSISSATRARPEELRRSSGARTICCSRRARRPSSRRGSPRPERAAGGRGALAVRAGAARRSCSRRRRRCGLRGRLPDRRPRLERLHAQRHVDRDAPAGVGQLERRPRVGRRSATATRSATGRCWCSVQRR